MAQSAAKLLQKAMRTTRLVNDNRVFSKLPKLDVPGGIIIRDFPVKKGGKRA